MLHYLIQYTNFKKKKHWGQTCSQCEDIMCFIESPFKAYWDPPMHVNNVLGNIFQPQNYMFCAKVSNMFFTVFRT